MINYFLGEQAWWFTVPAVVGTLYFLIQLTVMEVGGDFDLDTEVDTAGHDTPGHEFKVLSLQTLSAFLMGGGWLGFGAYRFLEVGPFLSSVVAVLSGVAVGWLLVTLLRKLLKFQSSGNIDLDDMVGLIGEVYVQVPPEGQGSGRVRVIIDGHQREVNATQFGESSIDTATRVKIKRTSPVTNSIVVEAVVH